MELRDYQQRAVEDLRAAYCDGHGGAILELGTGAGKTVTAASVVAGATALGGWVLWLAHRRELLGQAARTMGEVGLGPLLTGGQIRLRTVQSQLLEGMTPPAVIVVDEGHRAMAAGYRKVFARWPDSFRVLLTGTAWRSDGASFDAVATKLVRGPSVAELTSAGWLVPAVYWSVPGADLSGLKLARGDFKPADLAQAFDRPGLVGDVAATYCKLAGDRIGAVFASGVAHAEHVAEQLRARGLTAQAVNGATPKAKRAELLAEHEAGLLQVLCSADLLIEGWDNPLVSAVVMARATTSAIVWRQAVGRGLRIADGKTDCMVLDHGGNCARLGLVAEPLDYEAQSGTARRQLEGLALLTCPSCFAVLEAHPRPASCPRCFALLPKGERKVVEVQAGELAEFKAGEQAKRKQIDWVRWRKIDDERQQKGYKPGWTWAQYYLKEAVATWAIT